MPRYFTLMLACLIAGFSFAFASETLADPGQYGDYIFQCQTPPKEALPAFTLKELERGMAYSGATGFQWEPVDGQRVKLSFKDKDGRFKVLGLELSGKNATLTYLKMNGLTYTPEWVDQYCQYVMASMGLVKMFTPPPGDQDKVWGE